MATTDSLQTHPVPVLDSARPADSFVPGSRDARVKRRAKFHTQWMSGRVLSTTAIIKGQTKRVWIWIPGVIE